MCVRACVSMHVCACMCVCVCVCICVHVQDVDNTCRNRRYKKCARNDTSHPHSHHSQPHSHVIPAFSPDHPRHNSRPFQVILLYSSVKQCTSGWSYVSVGGAMYQWVELCTSGRSYMNMYHWVELCISGWSYTNMHQWAELHVVSTCQSHSSKLSAQMLGWCCHSNLLQSIVPEVCPAHTSTL